MANPTTKSEWLESIEASLKSVDYNYIQSRSISVVSDGLKKWNKDAYIPKKVSIGPRFMGSREDLLHMEEVKLRCMSSLIHRAGREGEAIKSLRECSDAVWELDEVVRASYLAKIEVENHELATIMLLDGCFLLELLISKRLDFQLPSRLFPPGPAAEVLKDEDVLSDLMLFENQIPVLVLHKLYQTLFPNEFEPEVEKQTEDIDPSISYSRLEEYRKEMEEKTRRRDLRAKKINNLALSVLGYSPQSHDLELLDSLAAPHILDLVHNFVNKRTGRNNWPSQDERKLNRCAVRLLNAGVTMKAKLPEDKKESTDLGGLSCFSLVWNRLRSMLFWLCNIFLVNGNHFDVDHIPQEVELKGLNFYFNFVKGKLEIQQLHITKSTKAKWCNLIAWEHHKKYKTVCGGKFTSAALIFNSLICSAGDVQLLKDKEIIVDHLKMSNQELMEFFRNIAFGVDHKVVDSRSYIQMLDDINNFSKEFFVKRMWRTVLTSFTYRQEWLLRFLNHNYNFVVTVLSVLAVVQTIYTILAFYSPK